MDNKNAKEYWTVQKAEEHIIQVLYGTVLGTKRLSDTQLKAAHGFLRYSHLLKKKSEKN